MSILHFDKLSHKRQQLFLEHPEEFTCQEKIDGTAFVIAIENGEVAIEHGRNSILELSEWDDNFWTSNYRESHMFVEKIKDQLISTYGINAIIHAEILSVNYPNTLRYNQDINRLVIFKPIEVAFNAMGEVENFSYPVTYDGYSTVRETRTSQWQASVLPEIPQEDWIELVRNITSNHYEGMIDKLVKTRTSLFGPTKVEGLVFRHNSGWMFKLVDRNFFTMRNTNNQALRRKLFRSSYMRDMTVMDIHMRDSSIDPLAASYTALKSIDTKFNEYLADPTTGLLDPWVQTRNLESVASLRNQLNGIINGR